MSTPATDLDEEEDDTARRKSNTEGQSGRETEDEMRKRILQELEEERRALEKELQVMREKAEEPSVASGSDLFLTFSELIIHKIYQLNSGRLSLRPLISQLL